MARRLFGKVREIMGLRSFLSAPSPNHIITDGKLLQITSLILGWCKVRCAANHRNAQMKDTKASIFVCLICGCSSNHGHSGGGGGESNANINPQNRCKSCQDSGACSVDELIEFMLKNMVSGRFSVHFNGPGAEASPNRIVIESVGFYAERVFIREEGAGGRYESVLAALSSSSYEWDMVWAEYAKVQRKGKCLGVAGADLLIAWADEVDVPHDINLEMLSTYRAIPFNNGYFYFADPEHRFSAIAITKKAVSWLASKNTKVFMRLED
jgi:hypothetical protein